ncbi:hypothetical protein HanOQP8_Chr04g0133861 [Helianthus annuus]|nr:hypothetical protein HanOQP8_Chr04g0133861 [Helianthus annuus]
MDDFENELYVTTGWNRIKQEMSITDNHLVVFEMLDMNTFEMSVFSCDLALLCYPPELSVVKEEPNYDPIEISDDESANPIADHIVEHNEDEGVPITFRVDNHYRLRKKRAQVPALDRKMGLTIEDAFGGVWEVQIGVEYLEGMMFVFYNYVFIIYRSYY